MAPIAYEHVTKRFGADSVAVKDLNLDIKDGEFMVLVGASGSGKSTALRMLAGLEKLTEGNIRIGSQIVNDIPARNRDIAMVFQSYALYPHMTVYDNIAFGLRMRNTPSSEIDGKVRDAAKTLGIDNL
jgi:multiple sugar transport system ATP-binding protein